MSKPRYRSFEEFWPYYVREHSNKTNRRLHFVGTTAALGCLAGATFLGKRRLFALAPVVGYGAAWVGHFLIEKNRPATFQYPLWSLMGDLRMWSMMLRGTMDAEVERVMAQPADGPSDAPLDEGNGHVETTGSSPSRDQLN